MRLFKHKGILCPNCEKPIEGHNDSACRRRMSRRYFFGALGGGIAAAAIAPTIIGDLSEQPSIRVIHDLSTTNLDVIFQVQIDKIKPHLVEIFHSHEASNEIIQYGVSIKTAEQYFRIPLKTETKYSWFDSTPKGPIV